jgi:hypothetical protein
LPNDWQATLLAVDGDTTQGVAAQLASLPRDATHLIVSAGGNDALMQAGILVQSVVSVAETMCRLSDVMSQFEASYRHMLDTLSKHHLPMAVCTIYDPRFDEPMQQKVAVAGLCHFNDVILGCRSSICASSVTSTRIMPMKLSPVCPEVPKSLMPWRAS